MSNRNPYAKQSKLYAKQKALCQTENRKPNKPNYMPNRKLHVKQKTVCQTKTNYMPNRNIYDKQKTVHQTEQTLCQTEKCMANRNNCMPKTLWQTETVRDVQGPSGVLSRMRNRHASRTCARAADTALLSYAASRPLTLGSLSSPTCVCRHLWHFRWLRKRLPCSAALPQQLARAHVGVSRSTFPLATAFGDLIQDAGILGLDSHPKRDVPTIP